MATAHRNVVPLRLILTGPHFMQTAVMVTESRVVLMSLCRIQKCPWGLATGRKRGGTASTLDSPAPHAETYLVGVAGFAPLWPIAAST